MKNLVLRLVCCFKGHVPKTYYISLMACESNKLVEVNCARCWKNLKPAVIQYRQY